MDEETRAIHQDIAETRSELGDAVQELSERLAPRQQAQRLLADRRDLAVERLRTLSAADLDAAVGRLRTTAAGHPRAGGAGIAGMALLLARRRRRRRR